MCSFLQIMELAKIILMILIIFCIYKMMSDKFTDIDVGLDVNSIPTDTRPIILKPDSIWALRPIITD